MIDPATILVVDDDEDVLTAARLLLTQHFEQVLTCSDPQEIDRHIGEQLIDVVLLDMNFAIGSNTGAEGLRWLSRILESDSNAVVVLMTAFADVNTAVRAMRDGAADFVMKPWQNDKLVATLNVAVALRRSRATVAALLEVGSGDAFIADAPSMRSVLRVVERAAPTDVNVLIRGENGTGKELIAQALHRQSARSSNALVTVDLGSVAETLFETELFGHTKGAFTDADKDRAGRFQAANGGTLFLDEIGNLPPAPQTKLLRALESREVVPIGSDQPVAIDVRLVSATNQPLEQLVADGFFREDLLYRINTIEIVLPPLRDRPEEIPALANYFLGLYARKYHLAEKPITREAFSVLASHHWPGNVRELSHAIERALILGDGESLDAESFSLARQAGTRKAG
jgi:DNA-binding NtrC family response regulator